MKSAAPAEPPAAADHEAGSLAAAGRVLVIGYGSPIRGDDALGPIAADQLREQDLPPHVEVVSRHVLTPELVGEVAQARQVIFLDASEDGPAGRVQVRRMQPAPQAAMAMGHFLDPRELLAWSRDLYDHQPQAWLVSLRGETFDFAGYELSSGIRALIGEMLRQVHGLIAQGTTRRLPSGDGPPASNETCRPPGRQQ